MEKPQNQKSSEAQEGDEEFETGQGRGERRRATGVSPHAGRTHNPGVDGIELAGNPECYIMTGPKTGCRSPIMHPSGFLVSPALILHSRYLHPVDLDTP